MTCQRVRIGNSVALVCGRGARPRQKCSACGAPATKECDFVVKEPKTSWERQVLCDKPLCDRCAVNIGPNLDHCPDHPPAPGQQLTIGGL